MIKTFKTLNRCLLAALVLFFTISSHSMATAGSIPTNAIYSTNTARSAHTLPFLNYSSQRYAANRLVETPAPPSVDVYPVLSMPLSGQTSMGFKMTIAPNYLVSSSRLLPLRI